MAVQTQIQWRRGTAASWTSTNPTLAAGEVGLETDTGKFKVGTGSSTWTALAYGTVLPATLTAKGSILAASAASTPAELAVGNNGETLVADSSTSTGLRYQPTNAAGKNCIINGGMDIFQRTTSTGFNAYALDRWYIGSSGGVTTTQSTAKTTPNSQYMMLMTAQSTQQIFAYQAVETRNAIYYAGKTVTLSAYAAGLTTTTNLIMVLSYSTSVDNSVTGSWTDISPTGGNANLTLSSTVTRWSATYDVPSTAKSLRVLFVNNAANITVGQGIYLGDVQLEVGSVATAFSRAGGTIQGELSACQRYYTRESVTTTYAYFRSSGNATNTTQARIIVPLPVQMRTKPAAMDFGGSLAVSDGVNLYTTGSFVLSANCTTQNAQVEYTHGSAVFTQYRYESLQDNNNGSTYLGFSAEL